MTRVTFRVDASNRIGTGHVVRCLTLAETLREQGVTCTFVHRQHAGHMLEQIRARGFTVYPLPAPAAPAEPDEEDDYAAWLGVRQDTDARETGETLAGQGVDWVIVDHYGLDADWERRIRNSCEHIAVVDDLANRGHDCDLLVDQNYVASAQERYDGLVPDGAVRLCGARYATLRPEYAQARSLIGPRRGPLSRILVFYGGADVHNETSRALRVLSRPEFQHLAVDVVVGLNHPDREDVLELARTRPTTDVHGPRDHLVDLMIDADLALGGGGTTTWERCALELPSIVTGVADNQMAFNRTLSEDGAVHFLGHWSRISDDDLAEALAEYVEDPGRLVEMGRTAWHITDGLGRLRIAEALVPTDRERLTLRPARNTDKAVSLSWENGPSKRSDTGSLEPNYRASRETWFEERLADPDPLLRVMVIPTGLPVGQVRIEPGGEEAVINYSVDPDFRGRGWGGRLLELAAAALKFVHGQQTFAATVDTEYSVSPDAFLRLGTELRETSRAETDALSITVLSDAGSWINDWVGRLLPEWFRQGHRVRWVHHTTDLVPGDLCFLLGCGQLVLPEQLRLHFHNLVVHASDLPKGRGWSPLTWQILEGVEDIPVTLLEAAPEVDAGDTYLQAWLHFEGHELLNELRDGVGEATVSLCRQFVDSYPGILSGARPQEGEPTWYPKRGPKDSELMPDLPLREQFDLLRVADNQRYPAFCSLRGHRYTLRIDKLSDE